MAGQKGGTGECRGRAGRCRGWEVAQLQRIDKEAMVGLDMGHKRHSNNNILYNRNNNNILYNNNNNNKYQ